ncbi:DUF6232 family protein [Actinoplanes sp. NPDC049316]|uniref:DUF6232 family protein n=1 Tax=Actinoplanes sp. NPDC049316 TaxID=3154727 RepID=UPI00342AB84C
MRVYYRGPDALLTDEHFVWRTATANRIFAVADLRDVGLVRGEVANSQLAGMLVTAAGLVTLTAASWGLAGAAVGFTAAAVALVVGMVVTVSLRQRAARRWRLTATYRGLAVTLYASADLRVFNQVTRALRRAIEDSGAVRSAGPLATV